MSDSLQSLLRDAPAFTTRVSPSEADPYQYLAIVRWCKEYAELEGLSYSAHLWGDHISEAQSHIEAKETERQEREIEMAYERRVA